MKNTISLSILGSSGGVAKAFLSILNKATEDINDPIHKFISTCNVHLIDIKQKDITYFQELFPNLATKISLYEFDLNDTNKFIKHLKNTKTTIVVDISWADTIETLNCCNKLGVVYINSAFENTYIDETEEFEGFGLSKRYEFFEARRDEFTNTTSIIGSGMNPGVVQWMALKVINSVSDKQPKACYIVESDNSFYIDESLAQKDTIYTTWSPECFLDEAILSYPLFMKQRNQLFLYKEVYSLEFKVTLGEKEFYGCLMPHEEVLSLGSLYDMECGFIYKVNDHTTKIIRDNIDNLDDLWDAPMKVLDPSEYPLKGEDLVGVLLVYDDEEIYMYNVLSNKEVFDKYKVSATYFQVACGLYGAISTILLDNIPRGIYYVDELLLNTDSNYGEYLSYHMKDFVIGKNKVSEGLLLDRIKYIDN
ncbi:S-adenosylmethionine decarboxylase related protein [Romboutsia sp.]|uniref:S-adenosylmethionine decarboxylase related protein n=1 Tax=Romboutsia sp. TaxID=1965302 RepID=UPI002CC789CB|nr:S-adenosylmethionine decarboxylase related protein [Romboutsia sp.]HSQ90467.1 S-adenosylmethionine decarboxylase related protein [Romboutsia sp.]